MLACLCDNSSSAMFLSLSVCVCVHVTSEIPVQRLDGHAAKVTCLLYPFNESTRYDADHLLSGGEDFSVVLWDMKCLRRLCTFVVHGGVLEQLIVPPGNCSVSLVIICIVFFWAR